MEKEKSGKGDCCVSIVGLSRALSRAPGSHPVGTISIGSAISLVVVHQHLAHTGGQDP